MWGFLLIFINMKESVGILIIAKNTNNFLLLHRSKNPIVWSTLTGKMDVAGESPLEAIKREINEELGINPNKIKNILKVGTTSSNHHIMVGFVEDEFTIPNLKLDENNDYGWFNEYNLPSPIHPKWPETLRYVKNFLNIKEEIKKQINTFLYG